ncbi:MAG: ADP-ribosylation factor-like protein [Promethearchaeota archaeon]
MNQIKCVIMGEGGVGKSTLVSMLQNKQIDQIRKPTIGVNVEKVDIDDKSLCIWDFGGQRRFQFMWDDFLKGSGLTLVVTDSSYRNVKETKKILDRYKKHLGSEVIAIANKQDIAGRLSPREVSEILGLPTYGMVAIKNENKNALSKIMARQIKN